MGPIMYFLKKKPHILVSSNQLKVYRLFAPSLHEMGCISLRLTNETFKTGQLKATQINGKLKQCWIYSLFQNKSKPHNTKAMGLLKP